MMKIIKKDESLFVAKTEGTSVNYYLRDEYELHFNVQAAHTTQTWHHHEKICESVFIIEGELVARWKKDGQEKNEIVRTGALIETENSPHTFSNETDKPVTFIVIKQVLSGINKKELLKGDKIIDEK
jgi:mannose-6-phosphate isomerase-like protein (cupin superfamily)